MKKIILIGLIGWQISCFAQTNTLPISGNVGIGTLSPDQKLTIKGGIGFDWNSSDKKLYSPSDGVLEWMTHDLAGEKGFAVSHQGTKRVFLNINGNSYLNGGNVGIGTTNPAARLQVAGGDASIAGVNYSYTGAQARLWLGDNAGAGGVNIAAEYDYGLKISLAGVSNAFNIKQFSGNVGIGTTNPGSYKLAVEGTIGARKLKVTQNSWADMVFKRGYKLMPLSTLSNYIIENGHLPEVPTEKQVKGKDIDVAETQTLLLRKIEELTLYIIEQDKKINYLMRNQRKYK